MQFLDWHGVLDGTAEDVRRFVISLAESDGGELPVDVRRDLHRLIPGIGDTLRVEIRERHYADATIEATLSGVPQGIAAHLLVDVHPHGRWHFLALMPGSLRRRALEPLMKGLDHLPQMLVEWRAGTPMDELVRRWTPPRIPGVPEGAVETPAAVLPSWASTDTATLEANRAGAMASVQRRQFRWRCLGQLLLALAVLGTVAAILAVPFRRWPLPEFLLLAVPTCGLIGWGMTVHQRKWWVDLRSGLCATRDGIVIVAPSKRSRDFVRIVGPPDTKLYRGKSGLVSGARYRVFYASATREIVNVEAAPPAVPIALKPTPVTVRWTLTATDGRQLDAGRWSLVV